MSPLEREIARQRARLERVERNGASKLARSYRAVELRLAHDLNELTRQIEQARAAGVEVRPGWLFAQERYQQLLTDLQQHTLQFLTRAVQTATAMQRDVLGDAVKDGQRLAMLALGPGPKQGVARVTGAFDRMSTAALDQLLGRAQDGGPLARLFSEIAPLAPQQVRDALAYGVAAGKPVDTIAREVRQASGVTLNRALVIARTETLTAHRDAVLTTYRQSGVVAEWQWVAKLDTRTCPVCWALSGTTYPLDVPFATHPNCRCARVPVTASWAQLGFHGIEDRRPTIPTGTSVFDRLPDADKLAILGRSKLDAYNAGEITLGDLVTDTHSPRWGPGRREASLAEALA